MGRTIRGLKQKIVKVVGLMILCASQFSFEFPTPQQAVE
tara:strand:- start:6 stop:122 length:117 start_codon:yes stop_codon:yes gene_type:complete